MKSIILTLICLAATFPVLSLPPVDEYRGRIGSTFAAPVKVDRSYYFVATTGVLYRANEDFTKVEKLFEGKLRSLGHLVHHGGKIYWGDGVHEDRKSTLHIYDLKSGKIEREIPVEGHIERPILIQNSTLLVPAGPGGIAAFHLETRKPLWVTKTYEGRPLHVDSNLVGIGPKVCGTTIYETKGIICLDASDGKVLQLGKLRRDPKSEVTVWNEHVIGFASEADLMETKFNIPADFFVYDVPGNKFKHSRELRGFNLFAPSISGKKAFITLSTGDFINFDLGTGKIEFIGQAPAPFINNSFRRGSSYCGIGIQGEYVCFKETKSGIVLETNKRLLETVVGRVTRDTKLIVPTRMGYYVEP